MVDSLQKKVTDYDATVYTFKKEAEEIIKRSKEIKNFANKTNGLGELISMNEINKKTIKNIIGRKNLKSNGNLIKALQGVEALIKKPEANQVASRGNRTNKI